jgi:hypothetical protein
MIEPAFERDQEQECEDQGNAEPDGAVAKKPGQSPSID